MKPTIENLSNELKSRGIRPSYQRLKVLEYLDCNRCHPTVDMIYSRLIGEIPTLSKTTIYNTLSQFVEAGIVRPLTIEGNEVRYDINVLDHGHFRCESCGEVYDFDIDVGSLTAHGLEGFHIKDKNVYFSGLCHPCQNKKH